MRHGIFSSVALYCFCLAQGQNVGIGTTSPNAPLQFGNNLQNRKLVLYEAANNDHQFYGMGINSGEFRFQVDASTADYVFYNATGQAASNELLRIKGTGNVGIGTSNPRARLQFRNEINNRIIILNESANNQHNFFGFGINDFTLRYQVSDPGQSHVFFAGNAANASGSNELFRIRGNGNVGIVQSNPNAPLQFASDVRNRKVVLFEVDNNDHQFYGLGVNSGVFRYQVPVTSDAHVFFTGTSASTSAELMRITGAGNVGIGQSNPQVPLQFATALGKKISLYRGPLGDAGFGVFGNELRIHSDYNGADITFGYDDFTNGFVERFRMRANGALSVAGNAGQPGQVLVSNGGNSAPAWAPMPGSYTQVLQTSAALDNPTGDGQDVPGLMANITLASTATVVFHIRLNVSINACLGCEPNLSYIGLQKIVPGGVELVAYFPITTPVSKFNTFSSGPYLLNLPAGSHTFKVVLLNFGPVSSTTLTMTTIGGGSNPGVLAWQIFPN
jgi:hypothetical protein